MRNRISSISATIILVAIVIFLAADVGYSLYQPDRLDSQLQSCTLDVISGEILVMKKDGLSWTRAEGGMILEPGSRIRTTNEAHGSIVFTTGTTTKLEPGTDVIIAKLEDSAETKNNTIVLKQQTGKTWNQVAKTDNPGNFQIETSSADIIVHGTLFSTEVDESGETVVKTTEGRVSVSAEGEEVQVSDGEMTTIKPGAAPSSPTHMPQARNELVFTVNKLSSTLITDPSGSSTGYITDDTTVNQISDSQISTDEDSTQTIRIREPMDGEYTITLGGGTEGTNSISVEGFYDGKSAFIHSESGNATSASELILKLHCDVIEGVLQSVSILNPSSQKKQPANVYTVSTIPMKPTKSDTPQPNSQNLNKEAKEAVLEGVTEEQKKMWFSTNSTNSIIQWLTTAGIIAVLGGIYIFVFKRS